MHGESGGGFRADAFHAVVLRRNLDVHAPSTALDVAVLQLRVRDLDPSILDGEPQCLRRLEAGRVRCVLAASRSGPFRGAGDLALELGINTDPLQDGSLLKQPGLLDPCGPEHGHIMLKLIRLHEAAPCLLLRVESLLAGYALGPLDSAPGEREHRVGAAFWTMGRVLPDVPGTNHAIHGPPRCVGMSLEVSLGQVAGGDAAIHADVGHCSICPFLEGLALRAARIVFPPLAATLYLFPFFGGVPPGASGGPGPGISG